MSRSTSRQRGNWNSAPSPQIAELLAFVLQERLQALPMAAVTLNLYPCLVRRESPCSKGFTVDLTNKHLHFQVISSGILAHKSSFLSQNLSRCLDYIKVCISRKYKQETGQKKKEAKILQIYRLRLISCVIGFAGPKDVENTSHQIIRGSQVCKPRVHPGRLLNKPLSSL